MSKNDKTRTFHINLEPVGAKAPSFQSEFIGNVIRKGSGQSFALLCQAQAFPVPLIRLVVRFAFMNALENLVENNRKKEVGILNELEVDATHTSTLFPSSGKLKISKKKLKIADINF